MGVVDYLVLKLKLAIFMFLDTGIKKMASQSSS